MKNNCLCIALISSLCVILTGCENKPDTMGGGERVCQMGILKSLYGMAELHALSNRVDFCTAFAERKWSRDDIELVQSRIQFLESHHVSKKSRGIIKIRKGKVPQTNVAPEYIAYVAKWLRLDEGQLVLLALDSEGNIRELTAEPTWPTIDLDTIIQGKTEGL